MAFKKKLYAAGPEKTPPAETVQTQRTWATQRIGPAGPADLERAVRQPLADKVSATPLRLLEGEHYSAELVGHVAGQTPCDLLVPLPHQPALDRAVARQDPARFTSRPAGFASVTQPDPFTHGRRRF